MNTEKLKIESGTATGTEFRFQTYRKVNDVRVETTWQGLLTEEGDIRVQRLNPSAPFNAESPMNLRRINLTR